MMVTRWLALSTCLLPLALPAQAHPRDAEIHDADTRAWWHTTEVLSNDSMEGRDTGSAAYERAAQYLAQRFKEAGLLPAGDNDTYFQTVPMHEVRLEADSAISLIDAAGHLRNLRLMYEVYPTSFRGAAAPIRASLTVRGACGVDDLKDVAGKIVLCLGGQRGSPSRIPDARKAGAAGVLIVDDPFYSLEPVRWPFAYARSVTLRPAPSAHVAASAPAVFTALLNADTFQQMLQGTDHDGAALLKSAAAKQSMPSFDLPLTATITLHTSERNITSTNVLAKLPGSEPALREEYLALSAHLDGYGFGEPVTSDALYNGTLDDAAYVALLIQMADDLHRAKSDESGDALAAPQRSLLFCVFTGEEKGLLGAHWFVDHMTVPQDKVVADVNLDQLRPLFPLRILTALAVHDTTLGATAQDVGRGMGMTVREDREPERGLLRRADHFPFLQAGIPAIGFIFGFDPGTDEERRYREWYRVRYHRPQDDLTQPVNFDAARSFDQFFYRFALSVANAKDRPRVLPGSPFVKQ